MFNQHFFDNFNYLFRNFTKMTGNFSPFVDGILPGISTFNNKNYNSDIVYTIKINRNFIQEDHEYNVYYKRVVVCDLCDINKNICEKCNNKRFIEIKQVFNNILIKHCIICDECKDKKCIECNGNEYTEEEKKVILNIKGEKILELIDKKQTIILKENGNILKEKTTDLVIIFTY
jgi:DnaJ-class molecular chaperone